MPCPLLGRLVEVPSSPPPLHLGGAAMPELSLHAAQLLFWAPRPRIFGATRCTSVEATSSTPQRRLTS